MMAQYGRDFDQIPVVDSSQSNYVQYAGPPAQNPSYVASPVPTAVPTSQSSQYQPGTSTVYTAKPVHSNSYSAQPVQAQPALQQREPVAAVYVAQPVPVNNTRYVYSGYQQPTYYQQPIPQQGMTRGDLYYRERAYQEERRREDTELACCAVLTTLCVCFALN